MRRAIVRTTHEDATTVGNAVTPDNTAEMTTYVHDETIETVVERETTGGLKSSVDDYLVNLTVALQTHAQMKTDTHTSTNHTETGQ